MTLIQIILLGFFALLTTYVFFSQNFMLMKHLPAEKTGFQNWWFMGGFVCLMALYAFLFATMAENNRLNRKNPCPQYELVEEQFYRIKQ